MSPVNSTPVPYDDKDKRVTYRSYLLRLWCADPSGACNWQASLEDPHTGEQIGFANLEQLFAYLMGRINGKPNSSKVE